MCVSVQYVAELLHEQAQPIVSTCSAADVQAAFNTIVTRIQRLWVTYIHTYRRTCIHTQGLNDKSHSRKRDPAACYLGVFHAKLCMFVVAHCQRIPGCSRSRCSIALCLWTHSIKMHLFFSEKLKFSLLLCFLDPSVRLPSPQEVMSVGDVALSVCYAASVKPVFSIIHLKRNFSTLSTPAPQSTCLLQLGPCHVEPCSFLMITCLPQCCHRFSWLLGFSLNVVSQHKHNFWTPHIFRSCSVFGQPLTSQILEH